MRLMIGLKTSTTPGTTWNNSDDKTNYWSVAVVLLATGYLLLLVFMAVKYYVKQKTTILCLLSIPLWKPLSFKYGDE